MLRTIMFAAIAAAPLAAHATDYCQAQNTQYATDNWCTLPNFPIYGVPGKPLESNPSTPLPDHLTWHAKGTNILHLVMGSSVSGANIKTDQDVANHFFHNYIFGNLNAALGSPMDTGQGGNNVFAAVARHYPIGSQYNVNKIESDGLYLRAFCSQNHTNCSPGKVWGGFIRLPGFIFRPHMTINVRAKLPPGTHSWAPFWLFSGTQYSPGPGGNPYQNYGSPTSLVQLPVGGNLGEIDINDDFPLLGANVPIGQQVDFGTPSTFQTPNPQLTLCANSSGYVCTYSSQVPPVAQVKQPMNCSQQFCDFTLSWRAVDQTVSVYVNGVPVARSTEQFTAPTYVDGFHGNKVERQGLSLMIGNQAIPFFSPSGAVDNDGIPDGWTVVVQSIDAWNGTVAQ